MPILRVLTVLLLTSAAAGTATATAQVGQELADTTTLQPGDALRIAVWRNSELSGEFTIAGDGSITHPLYREVRVTGLGRSAIEARLRTFLQRYEASPQFVIEPLLRVSVGGEVRQPNLFTLPPETSIAQAVAMAGGVTERGRIERVRVLRDGREIYFDLTELGTATRQARIQSGDQIFVTRRTSLFRDYIAPAGSITAALAALANIILR